jgi:hypothetical protein
MKEGDREGPECMMKEGDREGPECMMEEGDREGPECMMQEGDSNPREDRLSAGFGATEVVVEDKQVVYLQGDKSELRIISFLEANSEVYREGSEGMGFVPRSSDCNSVGRWNSRRWDSCLLRLA